MSIRVMTAIWEYSSHKGAALLLMLAIADHASDDGTNAYPSVRRLAQRTRLSERTVQRTIQECEASGELVVNRPDTREHRPNYYTIRLDRLPMGDSSVTHANLSPMPKRPAMGVSAVTRTVPIEPSGVSSTGEEAERLWDAAKAELRVLMNGTNYQTWISETVALRLVNGALVVRATRQQREALEGRFAPLVRRVLGARTVRFEG
jgi:hypothetical protein